MSWVQKSQRPLAVPKLPLTIQPSPFWPKCSCPSITTFHRMCKFFLLFEPFLNLNFALSPQRKCDMENYINIHYHVTLFRGRLTDRLAALHWHCTTCIICVLCSDCQRFRKNVGKFSGGKNSAAIAYEAVGKYHEFLSSRARLGRKKLNSFDWFPGKFNQCSTVFVDQPGGENIFLSLSDTILKMLT